MAKSTTDTRCTEAVKSNNAFDDYFEGIIETTPKHGFGLVTYKGERHPGSPWYKRPVIPGEESGIHTYSEGDFLKGEWQYWSLHNGFGKVSYPDDSFEGEWRNAERWNGKGKQDFGETGYCEGEWQNGKFWNGQEKEVSEENPPRFFWEGTVLEGEMWSGRLKIAYPNGNSFDGELKQGRYWNGALVLTHSNGDYFSGIVKNGKEWSGRCKSTYFDSRCFIGEIQNGIQLNGIETYYIGTSKLFEKEIKDGKVVAIVSVIHVVDHTNTDYLNSSNSFEGKVKHNRFWNGHGRIDYGCGHFFEGELYHGEFLNGRGNVAYRNGDYFNGEWKEGDKWNGRCKVTIYAVNDFSEYQCFEGELREGKFWNGMYQISAKNTLCEGELKEGRKSTGSTLSYVDAKARYQPILKSIYNCGNSQDLNVVKRQKLQ